ncbi:MAG: hypothetical protein ACW98U_16550 [Candidatus Thorarchaeota archaeon]|jgi:hypothetical protein
MTIHEIVVGGGGFGGGSVVYSAMKCDGCGMVYPLQEVAKGKGRRVSKDAVIGMLKQ